MEYQSYHLQRALSTPRISVVAEVTVQEMVRQQVRDTRVRRLVPEHQESVSRVDRCPYSVVFLREDLQIPTQR